MNNDFFNFCIQQTKAGQRVLDKPTFYRDFILDPQLNGPATFGTQLPSMTRIGPDITFTRSSSATFINQEGNIQVVDQNVPRFEWEGHRTNLATWSTFTSSGNSRWVIGYPSFGTILTGIDAPDGTTTAVRLSCNNQGSVVLRSYINSFTIPISSALPYTISFWCRRVSGTGSLASDLTDGAPNGVYDSQLVTGQWCRVSLSGVPQPGVKSFIDVHSDANTNSVVDYWGLQLETGTTATPYIATSGTSVTVSQPKGLLIEESRTNRVGEQNLLNWTQSFNTLSAGSGIIGLSSFIIGDESNTAFSYIFYNFPTVLLSATTYTFSCYVKKNLNFNNTHPLLRINYTPAGTAPQDFAGVCINQATGQVLNQYPLATSAINIQDFGTYYRTSFTFNSQSSATPYQINIIPSHGYAGAGSATLSGTTIEVAGIQVEQGAFPTTFIPTTATRGADLASITGNSFATLINNKEGTLHTEARSPSATAFFIPYSISKSGTSDEIRIGSTGSGNNYQFVVVNSTTQAAFAPATLPANTPYSFAAAYKQNDFAAVVNGGTVATDTVGTIPVTNQLAIGRRGIGTVYYLNGHIRNIAYWPKRLSNTTLKALTLSSLALGKYFAEDASIYTGVGPGVEVTRSSSATYFASGGKLTTAYYNRPRLDYDPVTNVCKGLLIEEQRTNLLQPSEKFNDGSWGKIDATAIADTTSAPNGTSSANRIYPNISTSVACIWQHKPISTGASKTYTVTAFFKAVGKTFAFIQVNTSRNDSTINYAFAYSVNLTNGSVGTQQILGGTPPTDTVATVTSVGSGWYRLAISFTTAYNISLYFGPSDTANSRTVTANGTDGIFVWGTQLEEGSFATSYIPTTNAAATRAADTAEINNNNFSKIYNPVQGTFYTKVLPLSGSQAAAVIDVGNTYNSIHGIWKSGPGGDGSVGTSWNTFSNSYYLSADAQYTPLTSNFVSTAGTANSASYIAYTYGPNSFATAISSSLISQTTDTSAVPLLQGYNYFNGHIQTLEYYNVQMTNQQLTALRN